MLESSSALSEVAKRATAHLRAGRLAEAERELRARLDQAEEWTQGVSLLALVLLEQGRIAEARQLLDDWAGGDEVEVASAPIDSGETFDADVSERELDSAFEAAETDPDEVFDADAIAQRAMRAADFELEELATRDSMYATQTMAGLLEQQGDERGASRIRAMTAPGDSGATASAATAPSRKNETIEELERWLVNLRGGTQ